MKSRTPDINRTNSMSFMRQAYAMNDAHTYATSTTSHTQVTFFSVAFYRKTITNEGIKNVIIIFRRKLTPLFSTEKTHSL